MIGPEIYSSVFLALIHPVLHILAAVMPAFFFGGCECCDEGDPNPPTTCLCSDENMPANINGTLVASDCGGCDLEGSEPISDLSCFGGTSATCGTGLNWGSTWLGGLSQCACSGGLQGLKARLCVSCASFDWDCSNFGVYIICVCATEGPDVEVTGTITSCNLGPAVEVTASFDLSGAARCNDCDSATVTFTE